MTDKSIEKKLIEQAIPSDYMREFYGSINREFTDFELAAMLWNSRMKPAERLSAIKELSMHTTDDVLKKQIESRLQYEDEMYHFFAENQEGRYVYVVEYEDEEWPCGFFKTLNTAIAYGKKDGKRNFSVCKQIIVEDELPMQKIGEWNPYLFPEKKGELEEYRAYPDGETSYSADGEILYCWSNSLPEEVKNLVDTWSSGRFENYPVILENPFEKGDIVMDDDEIGIIDISKEEMEKSAERMRSQMRNKQYIEYLDATSTTVQYIGNDGRISHDHPSLLFLKKVEKEELPSEIQEYAQIVSYMVQGKYSLDFFLFEYEKRILANSLIKM